MGGPIEIVRIIFFFFRQMNWLFEGFNMFKWSIFEELKMSSNIDFSSHGMTVASKFDYTLSKHEVLYLGHTWTMSPLVLIMQEWNILLTSQHQRLQPKTKEPGLQTCLRAVAAAEKAVIYDVMIIDVVIYDDDDGFTGAIGLALLYFEGFVFPFWAFFRA